jgi:NTE family protein
MSNQKTVTLLTTLIVVIAMMTGCSPLKINPKDIQPIPQLKIPNKRNIALVLGAGGARGFAHIGVLEELVKAGIDPDIIIGCSAGAIVGALYADDPNIKHLKSKLLHKKRTDIIKIDLLHMPIGLSSTYRMKEFLNHQLKSKTFRQLKRHLVTVATNLKTGQSTAFDQGKLIPAISASAAVPGVFYPVKHYGHFYVDGGVTDPLPTKVAKKLKAHFIISVDIGTELPQTMPTNLLGVMARSLEISYRHSSLSSFKDADIVINVPLNNYGMFSDEHNYQTYKSGRLAARKAIPSIKKRLNNNKIKNSLALPFS